LTYPPLGLDIFQLALCAFADALTAPQLQPHPRICEAHRRDWQEVRQDHEYDIVAATETIIVSVIWKGLILQVRDNLVSVSVYSFVIHCITPICVHMTQGSLGSNII
jgi:hypothetical protein